MEIIGFLGQTEPSAPVKCKISIICPLTMNYFTIKDLENLSGIKAHTIRVWEQRYNFLRPQRTDTNIRYYDSEELKKLLRVALLNKYGFKISRINRMSPDEIRNKVISLNRSDAQQEHLVTELINSMVDLDMKRFEKLLDTYISGRGIEESISRLIFPFLDRIGILWAANHINPAQEHLVSNIIRQKLIVGIEHVFSKHINNNTVLLFLPEGEHHELGLLFVNYLLKSRGVKVLYLGANTPLTDVAYLARLKNVNYIYTHLTTILNSFSLDHFVKELIKNIEHIPVVISGPLTRHYDKQPPYPVSLKKSLGEAVSFINSLS